MVRKHSEGLDALRGLAALAVLLHHAGNISGYFPRVTSHGYLSVDLFFMLSGFVIGQAYESRLRNPAYSRLEYAETRLVRLYPMILFGIAVGTLVMMFDGEVLPGDFTLRVLLQTVLVPALYTSGTIFLVNGVHWSLFFELVANAAHAAMAPKLTTPRLALLTAICGAAYGYVIWRHSAVVGFLTVSFLAGFPKVGFGFFAGLLIYRLRSSDTLPAYKGGAWLPLLGFVASVVLAGWFGQGDLLLIFAVFPLLVWASAGVTLTGRSNAAALRAGALSYPVYAIHAPLMVALGRATSGLSAAEAVSAWVLFLLAIWPVCALIEAVYDHPLRKWLAGRLPLWRARVLTSTAL